MSDDETHRDGDQGEPGPSMRQRLHAATGDRDAEAGALADSSEDDVTTHDAKIAVQRARGEGGADEPGLDHDIATPGDAEAVADHRTGEERVADRSDDPPE